MSKAKWLIECPTARQARAFRLAVKVGAYQVGLHDDSNGNQYWYVADENGRLMTDRENDSWPYYREALRAARRLWLRRLSLAPETRPMTDAGTPCGEPRRDALAEKVHAILPCWCDKAYTDRGLVQHDCPRHNFADEVLDLICAQAAAQGEEITALKSREEDAKKLVFRQDRLVARLGEGIKTIRALMRSNWSDNPDWRKGNEHTWSGKIDIVAEKMLAEIAPTTPTP